MVIGLYDLDLRHSQASWPNLELMKIFNYHNQNGDKVILMNKTDDEERFNSIIYFKDSKKLNVPRGINVIGKNKKIYGEGFFNTFSPLPDKYMNSPPDPIVYLESCQKFKRLKWDKFIQGSIVRFSNNDMTGYKPNAKQMYIVDRDFCQLAGTADFLLDNKQQDFFFFHTLRINSIEEYNQFQRFTLIINNPLFINFKFDKAFLLENINEKLHFNVYSPLDNESKLEYQRRIVRLAIFTKNIGTNISCTPIYGEKDIRYVLKWLGSSAQQSYAEYYKTDKEAISYMNKAPTEIRLLLKTNPKIIDNKTFDF